MSAQKIESVLTTNNLMKINIYKAGGLYRATTIDKKFVYRNHFELVMAIINFYEDFEWVKQKKEEASRNVKPLQLKGTN